MSVFCTVFLHFSGHFVVCFFDRKTSLVSFNTIHFIELWKSVQIAHFIRFSPKIENFSLRKCCRGIFWSWIFGKPRQFMLLTLVEIQAVYQFQSLDYPDFVQLSLYRMVHVHWCNRFLAIQSAAHNFHCCFVHDVRPHHKCAPSLRDVFPCIHRFWRKLESLISVQCLYVFAYTVKKNEDGKKKKHTKWKIKITIWQCFSFETYGDNTDKNLLFSLCKRKWEGERQGERANELRNVIATNVAFERTHNAQYASYFKTTVLAKWKISIG